VPPHDMCAIPSVTDTSIAGHSLNNTAARGVPSPRRGEAPTRAYSLAGVCNSDSLQTIALKRKLSTDVPRPGTDKASRLALFECVTEPSRHAANCKDRKPLLLLKPSWRTKAARAMSKIGDFPVSRSPARMAALICLEGLRDLNNSAALTSPAG